MKKVCLVSLLYCVVLFGDNKSHEVWWQEKLTDQKMLDTFQGWFGGINAQSRVIARSYIINNQYGSMCCKYY